jgi:hypothetical protein
LRGRRRGRSRGSRPARPRGRAGRGTVRAPARHVRCGDLLRAPVAWRRGRLGIAGPGAARTNGIREIGRRDRCAAVRGGELAGQQYDGGQHRDHREGRGHRAAPPGLVVGESGGDPAAQPVDGTAGCSGHEDGPAPARHLEPAHPGDEDEQHDDRRNEAADGEGKREVRDDQLHGWRDTWAAGG